ncbi:MAG: glycosyltransferase [Pseudanabaenaceae cyanobacterium]
MSSQILSPTSPAVVPQSEFRRLKALLVLAVVYGLIFASHGLTGGHWLIWGILAVVAVHSLRLILTKKETQTVVASHAQKAHAAANQDGLPTVSLLVAAKNEEAVIGNLAHALCHLDYPQDRLEVWIIDDNSSDRTGEVLTKLQVTLPQLRVLRRGAEAKGGKSGALNQVLSQTTGEIIGVFDADAQVPQDLLYSVVGLFQAAPPESPHRLGALQLRKAITNAADNFWTQGQSAEMALDVFLQERRIAIGGTGELRGNGQFVARAALDDCGGWNEQTITDDLDLTFRLHLQGWQINCLNFPAVQEEGVLTVKQLWHQRNRWAEGGFQRYLDYWQPLVSGKLGFAKTLDVGIFFLSQYLLPSAFIPDLIGALIWHHAPLLGPLGVLTVGLSVVAMVGGVRQSYQASWGTSLGQTVGGTLYMMHWIPVMASVTLRMAFRAKRLKWVKTVHQGHPSGLVDSLVDSGLADSGSQPETPASKT